ncbi:SRPBCC family protein [Microlunatus speluncae]|uniref:SRPBCC family protein n=1 Tax=Microlunatus speluncae TaxID=2594267 RepID=UPI0012664C1A|nr:SRPBCC family protein [Microlunatus speluncae]
MRDAVSIRIDAPPNQVWELVSDITNTGRFSPETFEAEWLGGATGPAVGVRFRGHVKRNGKGPTYWSVCRIVACEPGREFAFVVTAGDTELNTWRYVFEPDRAGSTVTESFELTDSIGTRIYWALLGRWRGRTNRNGMRTTLQRIKAEAEGTAGTNRT